jgi:chromosome segregation ATPase
MADETDNVVLEHLQRIRASQERTELDIADLKSRVSALEQVTGQILNLLGAMNHRMDRFDERLARIERRLDLVEA